MADVKDSQKQDKPDPLAGVKPNKDGSYNLFYKPGSGLPSHAPANFNVAGWGIVTLNPSAVSEISPDAAPNPVAPALAKILLDQHPGKVFLQWPPPEPPKKEEDSEETKVVKVPPAPPATEPEPSNLTAPSSKGDKA